ncbi:phosphomannomutase/phosphoglucomutase [Caproiciproducens galactitolivorans]|uniref:Phosphomannomutase/phosphoglucomutase n=1 Tax=Caproiciproducens galactitolivorans TaxID=642589 RepID=A0A4Z0YC21_9FIRM|nr:phosphomannomutase/phosphoglucomutase [Caproiciproducens galactitolivorans]QEY34923.1 phosphomannomutase/phosphoglucomutase [Caproiciproducens galactitolivorans]TGJ76373.1 phosphomannomutase/phosphoglucomutase [Caproiciproducens galactitolivorans]
MLTAFWKQFKSGTDIRGVACDGVPGEEINLTDEVIEKIASAFVLWLSDTLKKDPSHLTIAVGHDSRISADRIQAAVTRSLTAAGVSVLDCGLASTPSMFMTTVDLACDGSVQITASHHPFNRNGLKFFTRNGGLDAPDIERILLSAQNGEQPAPGKGEVKAVNYMEQYSAHLRELIKQGVRSADYDHPLKGFKIVVDAGNGAGGFYARDVLAPLGADTAGSQFLEPDGRFPNHIPNPENETAMKSVCAATVAAKANLGVIFDTDVDRGGAVDSKGDEINRNRLVAIASAIALEGNPGGTVVTDSITSSGLHDYIEKALGGKHRRFKRGYKNVINEAVRLNREGVNCPLAIETSGHAALRENYFLDDGAYLVTKIIIKAAQLRAQGKSLEDLLKPLAEPAEAKELRFPIREENFRECGERIIRALENYAQKQSGWHIAPDNFEGIRISFDKANGDGWLLLRLSVHDPLMPLNIESDSKGGVKKIAENLYAFLKTCEGLDISPIEKFLAE